MARKKQGKTKGKAKGSKPTAKSKCARSAVEDARMLSDPNRKAFFKWLSRSGHVVQVTPCASVPDIGKELRKYIKRSKLKGCYNNALKVAKGVPGTKVVVGQMYHGIGEAIDHAWNVTENNVHFDVTAESLDSCGKPAACEEYYAVAIMTANEFEKVNRKGGEPLANLHEEHRQAQAAKARTRPGRQAGDSTGSNRSRSKAAPRRTTPS